MDTHHKRSFTVTELHHADLSQVKPPLNVELRRPDDLGDLLCIIKDHNYDAECQLSWATPAPGQYLSQEELQLLVDTPVKTITIQHPVRLSASNPLATLAFIRFLRDTLSFGFELVWNCDDSQIDLQPLFHLTPPVRSSNVLRENVSRWSNDYKFGKFFWRNGPGFVVVKYTEDEDTGARFTIDDEPTLSLFMKLQTPTRDSELVAIPGADDALASLLQERIVLRLGEWYLSLPYRIRNWPIPYLAV